MLGKFSHCKSRVNKHRSRVCCSRVCRVLGDTQSILSLGEVAVASTIGSSFTRREPV
jgi:hypothetical protein